MLQHAMTMGIVLCMSVHNNACCQGQDQDEDEYQDGDQIEDQAKIKNNVLLQLARLSSPGVTISVSCCFDDPYL